ETLEETAWNVELYAFLGVYVYLSPHNDRTYVRHSFAAMPLRHDPSRALDTGILAAHWLLPEEILAPGFPARSPLVRRTIEDYLSGRRLPLDAVAHYLHPEGHS